MGLERQRPGTFVRNLAGRCSVQVAALLIALLSSCALRGPVAADTPPATACPAAASAVERAATVPDAAAPAGEPQGQSASVGPLEIDAIPSTDGRTLHAVVRLQTVQVASTILEPKFSTYSFADSVGTTKATGTLTALFMPDTQLSTLTARLTVQVEGQADQPFAGEIAWWHVRGGP